MRHCATCDCPDEHATAQPATSSKWARRQAIEAAKAAVEAARDKRKKPKETA